ncbi:hypothetical protein GPY37_06830 [Photorhabdus kayaii]|uniref:Uncharacterized protein n=1 Tax=Photorhabdus kayaii TaxID=230088 RepID=A0ABX0AWT4_9GAMM|nr:hypothetical protein [Photorhabdus kayaii]NDL25065.1 hypothetical protein [Photorhabdus kayaii]
MIYQILSCFQPYSISLVVFNNRKCLVGCFGNLNFIYHTRRSLRLRSASSSVIFLPSIVSFLDSIAILSNAIACRSTPLSANSLSRSAIG